MKYYLDFSGLLASGRAAPVGGGGERGLVLEVGKGTSAIGGIVQICLDGRSAFCSVLFIPSSQIVTDWSSRTSR